MYENKNVLRLPIHIHVYAASSFLTSIFKASITTHKFVIQALFLLAAQKSSGYIQEQNRSTRLDKKIQLFLAYPI